MDDIKQKTRLRPVVYTTSTYNSGAPERSRQLFMLKALQITQDPEKLRKMLHLKTVAEVYRTLDKMSMRKEYHEALARQGLSFDFIVEGIKDIAVSGEKDGDRLKAYQTILKSVGLDKYDSEGGIGVGTWEEALLQSIDEKKEKVELLPGTEIPTYEVVRPETPESVKRLREEEAEITSSIYEIEPPKGDKQAS